MNTLSTVTQVSFLNKLLKCYSTYFIDQPPNHLPRALAMPVRTELRWTRLMKGLISGLHRMASLMPHSEHTSTSSMSTSTHAATPWHTGYIYYSKFAKDQLFDIAYFRSIANDTPVQVPNYCVLKLSICHVQLALIILNTFKSISIFITNTQK